MTKPMIPEIKIESVTPQMAARWLGTMQGNRKLKQDRVKRYAREIIAGKWRFDNGESIKFDHDGVLRDGQHRLQAVIAAGVSQKFYVLRGMAAEAVITLDTGVSRSFADYATIKGTPYGSMAATVARMWHRFENGTPTVTNKANSIGHQEIEQILEEYRVPEVGGGSDS